jgi:hypothetical protein
MPLVTARPLAVGLAVPAGQVSHSLPKRAPGSSMRLRCMLLAMARLLAAGLAGRQVKADLGLSYESTHKWKRVLVTAKGGCWACSFQGWCKVWARPMLGYESTCALHAARDNPAWLLGLQPWGQIS